MKYDFLIKNGTCALPHSTNQIELKKVDIACKNKKIVAIESSIETHESSQIFDAKNLIVSPGLIDTQVHFREPGLTHKEDIEHGSLGALLGGLTGFFEMPNTSPSTTTAELLQAKIDIAKAKSHTHFAFYIGATNENIFELENIEKHPNCCGIKIFMGSSTGQLLVEGDPAIEQILLNSKKPIAVHSEDEFILRKNKEIFFEDNKTYSPDLHPVWRSTESALSSTRRILTLAAKTKRHVHLLHISSKEEVDYIREFKRQYSHCSFEVLANHLSLYAPECYQQLGTLAQQNPPIREKNHYDSLWKAVQEGVFDIIASDHAPHTLDEKSKPYPHSPSGTPGVQTLLPRMLQHVNDKNISLEKLIWMMSERPRQLFNIKNKGRIEIGFDADFSILDLNKEHTIQRSEIVSKSQWSPFENLKIKGWPVGVILNGELAMLNGELKTPHRLGQAFEF